MKCVHVGESDVNANVNDVFLFLLIQPVITDELEHEIELEGDAL